MKKMMIVLAALASVSVFADNHAPAAAEAAKTEATTASHDAHGKKKMTKKAKKEAAPAAAEAAAPAAAEAAAPAAH